MSDLLPNSWRRHLASSRVLTRTQREPMRGQPEPGLTRLASGTHIARSRQIVVMFLLMAAAAASLLQGSVFRNPIPVDFAARYAAGQLVDQGVNPYDSTKLHTAEQELMPGLGELPFYDPPPTAAVFRLISMLPVSAGALVWQIMSVVCLALIACLLGGLIGVRHWMPMLGIASLLAIFGPVRHSIALGQVELVFLLPLFLAIWLCWRRRNSTLEIALSSALAVVSLCKPQLAYLPVIVIVIHCYRLNRAAAVVGVATSATLLILVSRLVASSAHWSEWLSSLTRRSDSPGWVLRLVLLSGGIAGVLLGIRAVKGCRRSFEGWLLLAASCNGLGAALVRWNPQWHVVLALPVLILLALFVGRVGDSWSLPDRFALAFVAAACLPDALITYAHFSGWAAGRVPLALSAMVLAAAVVGRLVSIYWAALIWILTSILIMPPGETAFVRVKGLLLCLAVLWLLPQVARVRRAQVTLDLRPPTRQDSVDEGVRNRLALFPVDPDEHLSYLWGRGPVR